MRANSELLATLLSLLVGGCGGDAVPSEYGAADGATDSTIDVVDAANDAVEEDASRDAGSDAQDGGGFALSLKCAGGSQCDGGAVCCGALAFRPECSLLSLTASCKAPADCPTTLQPFCGGNETARLCDSPSDCTEPSYDRCCNFPIVGTNSSLTMCASAAMAAASGDGGSCL